jgi:hypothetical protein
MKTGETNEDLHHHQVSDHMMIFRENIAPLLESANKVYVGNKLF